MTRQLVFVHGRAQENKDAAHLKAGWIEAWSRGLAKSGLQVPIAESDIRFPYYGQTLLGLVTSLPADEIAEVIVKGSESDAQKKEFVRKVLAEVQAKCGIDDAQVAAELGSDVVQKGPLNWQFVHGILRAIDRHVPGASGPSIALATNDVYEYLKNPGVRDPIEAGVRSAIARDSSTVVVSHSLGTVVTYNLLRREGETMGWKVPLLVTVGCPLAVTAIKQALRPIRALSCVRHWYNAMDKRDVVALYPLDKANFDIDPAIENNTNVDNHTENRHGIDGYLDDKDVARRIHDALVAPI